jgi:flagellar hook-associated protein 3 FlgL
MRISTQQMQLDAINSLFDQQAALNKTQVQVATGRRILTPADDPVASANTLGLKQTKAVTERYLVNADAAKTRLSIEEDALISIGDALHRVRELAIQGNNDSNSNNDRIFLAAEIRQVLEQVIGIANGKDQNDDYLFAGFQGNTRPFAQNGSNFDYFGDDGQRLLQVGPSRQIADGDSGNAVFRTIKNGNGIFTTQDNISNLGSGIIDPGTVIDPASYVADTYSIVLAEQTNVTTASSLTFNDDITTDDALSYDLVINGTTISYAEGAAPTLTDLVTDINGSAANVTAYDVNGTLYLANNSPSTTPITISETLTGASETTDSLSGFFGSSLSGAAPSNTITLNSNTPGYVVLDGTSTVISGGAYQDGSNISFNGISTNITGQPVNGDSFTISPSVHQDIFTTIQNLAIALESAPATSADQAEFHNAMNRVLVDIDQSQENILNIRTNVGARLNAIDSQSTNNEELILQTEETLSVINDLDYAEAVSRLNLQLTGLEAAQKAFTRVQGLSLFNYL